MISNDLIQIVSFPALMRGCCSQSSSSGFISFLWYNYLFYNCFPSIGKSWLCCLSFQWLSVKLKRDVTFYCIAYNYLRADWEGTYDHLWTAPWENIFKPDASVASEFCQWIQVGIYVYIPHCKYQVKPHSFPWFLAACAAVITHRNHFSVCTNKTAHRFPEIWLLWLLATYYRTCS